MKATVSIRKCISEAQYEPFEVILTIEKEVVSNEAVEELYEDALEILNKKMDERLEFMEE